MKIRNLLLTIALFGCSVTGWGQTILIESEGADPITENIDDLEDAALLSGEKITLTGSWTNANLARLREVQSIESNAVDDYRGELLEVDMSRMTFALEEGETAITQTAKLFQTCALLTKVIFPATETTLKVDLNSMFYNCVELVTVENLDKFTNITSMANTFRNCKELTSLIFPQGNDGTSISFSYAFNACEKLTGVSNLAKFKVNNLSRVFLDCKGLVVAELPEGSGTTTSPIDITSAFQNCNNLLSVKNLDKFTNLKNFDNVFNGCEKLTYITLPTVATTPTLSFNSTFNNCYVLTRVENLEKFTMAASKTNTFKNCRSLVYADINFVSASDIFAGCNPNCLIFIPEGKIPHAAWLNVIQGGKAITDINLSDATTIQETVYRNPFYCPKDFSLEDKKITYIRTYNFANGKNGWNTFCLPFDAKLTTATATLPYYASNSDTQGRYWVKNYKNSPAVGKVAFDYLSGNDVIPANTPCIVALPGEEFGTAGLQNEMLTFTATGIIVKATPESMETPGVNYTFKANYSILEKQSMYLLISGTGSDNDCFTLYDEGNLAPFRAYFVANNAPAKVSTLSIDGDGGGTTRVVMVQPEQTKVIAGGKGYIEITVSKAEKINIIAIDGRIVNSVNVNGGTTRINLTPGIYIAGGEKVIVR